ncbi:MAG: glycosyltransferase [Actinomycetota bacterium]|nr:glycosyltransferase [Actinomycetota bacterium]
MTRVLHDLIAGMLIYALAVNLFYVVLLCLSAFQVRREEVRARIPFLSDGQSHVYPPISVIVPAFNEELTIVATVESLLRNHYPALQIIVVNDGSRDGTLQVLMEKYGLAAGATDMLSGAIEVKAPIRGAYSSPAFPGLLVMDKENSGKGESVNVGLNAATSPLVAMIDADSLVDPDAFFHIAHRFLDDWERLVAVGGYVRVGNGCDVRGGLVERVDVPSRILPRLQLIEYAKAFVGGRTGWSLFNSLMIISGAFGVFRRELLVEIGGYSRSAPGEDMEIVLRLHRLLSDMGAKYRVGFSPEAVCWTQAPEQLASLSGQRRRWAKGNFANIFRYKGMVGKLRYGAVGLFGIPYLGLVEVLGPYLGVLGMVGIGYLALVRNQPVGMLLWLLGAAVCFDYLLAIGSLALDMSSFKMLSRSQLVRLALSALSLSTWYYYLTVVWRIRGHVEFFTRRHSWNAMVRTAWGSR